MRRFIFTLLLVGLCNYAEANQTIRWTNMGPLANSEKGEESRHSGDSDQDIRIRGNVLGSFRRTATRLRKHDGLTPSTSFDRTGLDWTKAPLANQEASRRGVAKSISVEEKQKPVVIPTSARNYMLYFTLRGCGACKVMRPIIEELQRAGQEIYIVEQRSNPRLVQQYAVRAYPTMVIFNQGTEVKTYIGVVTAQAITEYLESWTPDNNNSGVDYDFVDGPSIDYKLW